MYVDSLFSIAKIVYLKRRILTHLSVYLYFCTILQNIAASIAQICIHKSV